MNKEKCTVCFEEIKTDGSCGCDDELEPDYTYDFDEDDEE